MEKRDAKIIAGSALLLSGVPLVAYLWKFGSLTLSRNFNDWGVFSGFLNSFLGPLYSFITLALTAYIAYTIKEYDRKKDKQNKEQNDVKEYLELYQYFVSPEFREKRAIGWGVIRRAVENADYADFLVQETFMSRYTNRVSRTEVYSKFKSIYGEEFENKKEFLHKESEDRHKLDAVVNFFELLAAKDVPVNNCSICDFYYDSWRPILCWYAKKMEEGYEKYDVNKRFSNRPILRSAIELLDKKYLNPEIPNELTIDNIDGHPLLKWYYSEQSDE